MAAFNGSGTYVRSFNWQVDAAGGVPITDSRMDTEMDGFATGLSNAICRDGQSTTTLRIPFALGVGLGDGSAGTPAVNFTADTNSGLYRIGGDNLGIGVNGAKVLDISTTGLGVVGTLLNDNGTVSLPAFSFTSDPDSGVYRIGANNIGVGVNGAKVLDIATTGLGVTGALGISGATTLSSTLAVTGATTLSSTLSVGGDVQMNSHKLIGLAAGSAAGDSVRFAQVVKQGSGIDQGPNEVAIGWQPGGAGLKATVDTTDEGFFWMGLATAAALGDNGYQKLPSGLYVAFGTAVVTMNGSGDSSVAYSNAFPNGTYTVVAVNGDTNSNPDSVLSVNGWSASSFNFHASGGVTGGTMRINYIAVGH